MLGFQGTASSSKVYRCVACSATFSGLASLLVHQATHASVVSKISAPAQPNVSLHETLFSSMDSSNEHPTAPTHFPESSSPSFFICDCGEEFHDFSLMLEHKRSHISETELMQPLVNNSGLFGAHEAFPIQHASFSPAVTQASGLPLSCPSTSRAPAVELPTLTGQKPDVSLEDGIAMETATHRECTPPQDVSEKQLENMPAATEKISDSVEDMHFQSENSVPRSNNGPNLPRTNNIMKLLASAYMKRFTSPQSPIQNDDKVTPKQEVVPVDITSGAKSEVMSPMNDLSVAQLRRLLARPNVKTKAPSISRVLESSKKKVVSLTKTLSPVIVLETRQKLKDPSGICTYGRYQCGRCRRVFENLDRLTEHHFLHKKERIKCCRRCKQLIIGRLPLPDTHICPQLGNKPVQLSKSFRNKVPFSQKLVPFHSLSNTRKVFFCPLCRHSYARRWNLKNHKCQGPRSVIRQQVSPSLQNMLLETSVNKDKTDADIRTRSQCSKTVGVGTEHASGIKVEGASPQSNPIAPTQLVWAHPAQSFSFYPKSSQAEKQDNTLLSGISIQKEESSDWDEAAGDNEDSNEGQWTMPLDDEMEVLSSIEKTGNGIELGISASDEHPETAAQRLRCFVRHGVKRYPCNRCQKTYSRASTLRRHLRLCGFRPPIALSGSQGAVTLNANNMKPMFPCNVCGRNFNRKDNMMTHRNRCQLKHSMMDANRGTAQLNKSANPADSQTEEDDSTNWGIMSLPSVLPRRVTCECGVGFTSPRLLLEHLQKHAQESYTCPTCGETVSSWADYEVHLQIHMHPHHQLLKGLQPQRSQPLLIRFQQQRPQQQPSQSVHQPPKDQSVNANQLPNPVKKQQRIVCTRCGNTFATRCSLRRHLSWNRCKGLRATNPTTNPPRTYNCSHCNSNFPNSTSLLFHQRSGTCKPAIKPVRCPVCLRWFGTVDGLQKHLLTHKQP